MKASSSTQAAGKKPARILIIASHPLTREGLAAIVRSGPGLSVCGHSPSHKQALTVIAAAKPDLAIIDLTLQDLHGLELVKDIRVVYPKLRMLVVSTAEESYYAERMLRAGAHGYLTSEEAPTRIVPAIRRVLAGEIYLSEKMAVQIAGRIVGRPHHVNGHRVDHLSDREMQVFELVGQGFDTHAIARELSVGVTTVETHRARIKDKLKLEDANQLLRCAICWKQRQTFD
jgi:DNA-binding NarL/FixJ family response regulator